MHTTWRLPEKERFYAFVMVEKTNLTICHGVMGTIHDRQGNEVDARDSS